MKLTKLSPYLKKLDDSMTHVFGKYDIAGPNITYNIECRNPIAFSKIRELINDWSDKEYRKAYNSGENCFPGDFCAAYIEDAGENNIYLSFGDPQNAIHMLEVLGGTIRQIQHNYPPLVLSVDVSELKAFDRASLVAGGVPFNDAPLPHRPRGREGGR